MSARKSYFRLLQPPAQSFFLFGMRGVGTSTWARQAFPDARRFDLLARFASSFPPTLVGAE
jgi:hypothetical protein